MRNFGMAVMIVVGLINVDHLYYNDAMLKPVLIGLWRQALSLLA